MKDKNIEKLIERKLIVISSRITECGTIYANAQKEFLQGGTDKFEEAIEIKKEILREIRILLETQRKEYEKKIQKAYECGMCGCPDCIHTVNKFLQEDNED